MWDMYYADDASNGDMEYVDSADEPVGCTGGHKVCSDGCNLTPERDVQPRAPSPISGNYGPGYGWLYFEEYAEETSQGAYCDSPDDTCWNDINQSVYMGRTIEVDWFCNQ